MRHIGDDERRARIGLRHGIAPGRRLADAGAATTAMTVLHATEPGSVYLGLAARVDGITQADVDRALYEDRSVVRQLAMRRTLFGFPRDLLPSAWGSASARVASQERARIGRDVVAAGLAANGDAWVDEAGAAIVRRLAGGEALTTRQLRAEVPEIAGRVLTSANSRWGGELPIAPRLLTYLGARGIVARGPNAGHWRTSRPTWTLMADWLGEVPAARDEADGYSDLVGRWLWTFGPGTERDIAWWLGSPLATVRTALATLGAEAVTLDGGGTGWVLPDDLEPATEVEPWAALLPVLDPTTMGWKERDFYLGPHGPELFDTAGNAGTTAWWNGRIVGCWVQDDDGSVRVALLEEVPRAAHAAFAVEAERLGAWLGDVRIVTVYTAAAMRAAKARPAR
jgi:hypothetical protein